MSVRLVEVMPEVDAAVMATAVMSMPKVVVTVARAIVVSMIVAPLVG